MSRFNQEQLLELEEVFKTTRYPTSKIKSDLASKHNLTKNQVDTWFQNRRTTAKHKEKDEKLKNETEILQNEVFVCLIS